MYNSRNRSSSRGGRHFGGKSRRPSNRNRSNNKSINPAKFVNKNVAKVEQVEYQPTNSFADFRLTRILNDNLSAIGFDAPSAIQDQAIPLSLAGKDIIGLANTGTGKTAAFLLPIIDELYKQRAQTSVLILAPTRELAQQIDSEFKRFTAGMKLFSTVIVGGMNFGRQLNALKRRPHVIIGTPGRVKDHIQRRTLRLDNINKLVLDEADRMLDMGFINDIREIISLTPGNRQTFCFSATFNDGVKKIVHDFMEEPEIVSVKVSESSNHIYQDVVHYRDNDHKRDLLIDMLSNDEFERVVIFGETKFGVQRLSDSLDKMGIPSRAIHGNKSQGQRNRALADFKENKSRVLVATDVAARGLDITDVTHVINFDLPQSYDDYIHRIGRTGRGGKSGSAFTFVKQPTKRY